jgi:hypothetical protein
MANKFVVKTTEEFTYDEQGRVVKKVTTEESYEVGQATITTEDFIKKAVGVPNSSGIVNTPWKTTVTYDTAKADTSGITHNNITVNANNQNAEEIAKTVKKAIEKHQNY